MKTLSLGFASKPRGVSGDVGEDGPALPPEPGGGGGEGGGGSGTALPLLLCTLKMVLDKTFRNPS